MVKFVVSRSKERLGRAAHDVVSRKKMRMRMHTYGCKGQGEQVSRVLWTPWQQ